MTARLAAQTRDSQKSVGKSALRLARTESDEVVSRDQYACVRALFGKISTPTRRQDQRHRGNEVRHHLALYFQLTGRAAAAAGPVNATNAPEIRLVALGRGVVPVWIARGFSALSAVVLEARGEAQGCEARHQKKQHRLKAMREFSLLKKCLRSAPTPFRTSVVFVRHKRSDG